MTTIHERRQELQNLAKDPRAKPEDLQKQAWVVLGNVLQGKSEGDAELMPDAERLLGRNASNDRLLKGDLSDLWMDAHIALATWPMMESYSRGESVSDETRLASRQKLAALIARAAGRMLQLDFVTPYIGQKVVEAMTLSFLNRNFEARGTFGFPAHPASHHFRGVDRVSGTTSHQIYAVGREHVVPTATMKKNHPRIGGTGTRGVLAVTLSDLLQVTGEDIPQLRRHLGEERDTNDGLRLMVDLAIRAMVDDVANMRESNPASDELGIWLDRATNCLADVVDRFDSSDPDTMRIPSSY